MLAAFYPRKYPLSRTLHVPHSKAHYYGQTQPHYLLPVLFDTIHRIAQRGPNGDTSVPLCLSSLLHARALAS